MNKYNVLFRINLILLVTLLSVSFTGCNKSHATREVNSPIETAARQSETIVLARCTGNEMQESGTGMIFTVTTFDILEVIKGEVTGDTIRIRIVGGDIGDMELNVPDRPEFIEREEVVLFLGDRNDDGYYVLQSFSEGVFRVNYDESSESRYISSPVDDMTLYNSTTGKEMDEKRNVSLDNFIFSLKRLTGE